MDNKNLKENWIKKKIDKELNDEEEFKKYVECYLYKDKLTFKQLKKKLILKLDKTDSKSSKNIEKIKKTKIIENFENANLFDELKKEKKIVIILDNYRVHKSKLVKSIVKKLNIELIFLPSYSPKLNPIEQVLRTIKRRLS